MLFDIDVKKGKANQWTTNADKALVFYTEKDAQELIRKFALVDVHIGTTTINL